MRKTSKNSAKYAYIAGFKNNAKLVTTHIIKKKFWNSNFKTQKKIISTYRGHSKIKRVSATRRIVGKDKISKTIDDAPMKTTETRWKCWNVLGLDKPLPPLAPIPFAIVVVASALRPIQKRQ